MQLPNSTSTFASNRTVPSPPKPARCSTRSRKRRLRAEDKVSRKGAKTQRKTSGSAAALCVVAPLRETALLNLATCGGVESEGAAADEHQGAAHNARLVWNLTDAAVSDHDC